MTPNAVLALNSRRALPLMGAVISELKRRASHVSLVAVIAFSLVTACSADAPTAAPTVSIDRIAAARVMPSVTDARLRLAPAIENVSVRDRVTHDLQELETALANGDGQKARFHVRVVGSVLTDYRVQQSAMTKDGPDVIAMSLMLTAVSDVVDAGFKGLS